MTARKIWTVRTIGVCDVQPPAAAIPPFRPPSHPESRKLRQTYKLEKIAGDGNDFTRVRRIKSWARSNWNHGYTLLGKQHTASRLLAAAARGASFPCSDYARV